MLSPLYNSCQLPSLLDALDNHSIALAIQSDTIHGAIHAWCVTIQ